MQHLLLDPAFWVAVGFTSFVVVLARPASRFIIGALDARAARIQAELNQAEELRQKAEALLVEYQAKYDEAVAEAQSIVKHAEDDAQRYAASMEQELQAAIEKRRALAEQKIAQAEQRAIQEVKQHVVDITISAARELIAQRLASGQADAVVTLAAADMQGKLH